MSATVFFADPSSEIATLTNTFSVGGVPTDPAAVTVTVTTPTGVTSTPAVTHVSTGVYSAAVACTLDGIWVYKWAGTGAASDVTEGSWTVGPSNLSQNYCSAEELKSRLGLTRPDFNSEIALAVATASRAVDGYCERYFYRAADTRTYVPDDLYRVRTDDLVSVTALATDPAGTAAQGSTFPVSWPVGSFQMLPYNPGKGGEAWPYTSIRAVGGLTFPWVTPLLLMRMDRVQVSGVFGWPAVPQAIRTATLIAAAELFRMKDMPVGQPGEFSIVSLGPNLGIGELLGRYCLNPFLAA